MTWDELVRRANCNGLEDMDKLKEGPDDTFRFILCMMPESSHELLNAQFVQCDISFKRVVGYKEFELVSFDVAAGTGKTFFPGLLPHLQLGLKLLCIVAYS